MKKIICAVLCFNNIKIIQSLINDLKLFKKKHDIDFIFIDDCSQDNTDSLIKSNNLKIIRHHKNLGYGGAVKSAFGYAIKRKRFQRWLAT